MFKPLFALTAVSMALLSAGAYAQALSPVGLWKTIDDETGKPKSLVRISEHNGEYQGKIEKLLREPEEDPNPTCSKCEGDRKGQPIIGMTILTGMKKDGSEYIGGRILDPAQGTTYKSKMALHDGGKKLEVRGYIGLPAFGRSQIWERIE